MTRRIAFTWN